MTSLTHTAHRLREEARTATARGVVKDVLRGYRANDVLTYASAIAFQVLFALIPLTLFGLGLLGFFGLEGVYNREVVPQLQESTPFAAFEVIDSTVRKVLTSKQGFWITIGAVVTVWELSGAVRAIMGVFDRIYSVERERSFRERYTVSILLAIGTGLLLLAAVAVGRAWVGVLLVVAFGVGMATSLAVVGIVARDLVLRVERAATRRGVLGGPVRAVLGYGAAVGVCVVGALIVLKALQTIG